MVNKLFRFLLLRFKIVKLWPLCGQSLTIKTLPSGGKNLFEELRVGVFQVRPLKKHQQELSLVFAVNYNIFLGHIAAPGQGFRLSSVEVHRNIYIRPFKSFLGGSLLKRLRDTRQH